MEKTPAVRIGGGIKTFALTSNHNPHEFSRRSFLKATACLTLGSLAAGHSLAATLIEKGDIALVVSRDDVLAMAIPPRWALGELKTALEGQGATVRIIAKVAEATAREFCVVVAGMNSPLAQSIVRRQKISAPTEAESLYQRFCSPPAQMRWDSSMR